MFQYMVRAILYPTGTKLRSCIQYDSLWMREALGRVVNTCVIYHSHHLISRGIVNESFPFFNLRLYTAKSTLIAKFIGPTWGPPGADRCYGLCYLEMYRTQFHVPMYMRLVELFLGPNSVKFLKLYQWKLDYDQDNIWGSANIEHKDRKR